MRSRRPDCRCEHPDQPSKSQRAAFSVSIRRAAANRAACGSTVRCQAGAWRVSLHHLLNVMKLVLFVVCEQLRRGGSRAPILSQPDIYLLLQSYTQFGGLRPFGVSFLFAGWDKHHGFQLYHTDPSGNYSGWKATAIGVNNQSAQTILKQVRQRRYA